MKSVVTVNACGPLRETKLILPDRGLVAIVGPSLSGKSLLEEAISSAAFASMIVSDSEHLGTLVERLISSDWSELFSRIDLMEYLSIDANVRDCEEYFRTVNEVLLKATDNQLDARGYLARMAFIEDLCLSREISCWENKTNARLEIDLKINQEKSQSASIRARLPLPNPRKFGIKTLIDNIKFDVIPDIVGLNVGLLNRFLRSIYGGEEIFYKIQANLSSLFVKTILKKYRYYIESDIYTKLKEILKESWEEISSYRINIDEIAIFEEDGRPMLKVGRLRFPWTMTSEGFLNIISHWLLFKVIPILALDGRKIVIGLEEPEAHLDPYVTYKLPEMYAIASKRWNTVFIFSTHSEALLRGIEDAVREGILEPERVKIYETIGKDKFFTLKECRVKEDGLIEDSRFTKIAWRIFERGVKHARGGTTS